MYDLIIIGGGPAGITAAIYAARKKLKFAIIVEEMGGEVAKTTYIENYTGFKSITGEQLTKEFEEHMKMFDVEYIEDSVTKIEKNGNFFKVISYGNTFDTKTILITTGAVPKRLNIPGEMEYASKGVSWCATCDAPLYKDKEVAVIGAGNTGLTSVLSLFDYTTKVYLISKYEEPKADPVMIDKAIKNPKLELIKNAMTQSINGDDKGRFVKSITVKLSDGTTREIPVQGVFINIGYSPNVAFLDGMVNLSLAGEIIVDEKNMTSVPGIFAAGDVTNAPYKQIIIAAGAGSTALLGIYDYLSKLEH